MARRGVSRCPRPFPRRPSIPQTIRSDTWVWTRAPQLLPNRAPGAAHAPIPRATGCPRPPTRSRAAQVSQTSRLPGGLCGRARWSETALPQRPGARGRAVGDLGFPRERRTSGRGPRDSACHRGLDLANGGIGGRARVGPSSRVVSPGLCRASPASDLESCCPRAAPCVPSRPRCP